MVPSARKAALRMGLTECIARAASPQALLSFRLLEELCLNISPCHVWWLERQSHGRGNPGQLCHVSNCARSRKRRIGQYPYGSWNRPSLARALM